MPLLILAPPVGDFYTFSTVFHQNMVSFHNLGALLGRLSPRCTDPLAAVRIAAVDCIYPLLNIQLRYEGTERDRRVEMVQWNCFSSVLTVNIIGLGCLSLRRFRSRLQG